ncbi:Alpha/Beta hydrolase protein [Entophlyctis helioformis]|nr:Alpha/Beta hydrolase protein [Entophlyctis helioformis]
MISLVNFTRSTYCIDGLATWTCTTCGGHTAGTTNITLHGTFANNAFGLSAVHPPSRTLVLAFRGSRNLRNWIQSLSIAKADTAFFGAPEAVRVHSGFLEAWTTMRDDAVESISRLRAAYPGYRLLVTGHSLGGAVATLAAMDIVSSKILNAKQVSVFTLNQPRVGNTAFAAWMSSHAFASVLRVVNQNDWTPHLPPLLSKFLHTPTEVWIADGDGRTLLCNVDDTDQESDECSNSLNGAFSVAKHNAVWGIRLGIKAC